MTQRLRIVVHHQNARRLAPVPGRAVRPPTSAGAAPAPASPATGSVKVNRAPWPAPPLSARMRPPWASTSPLQMASPGRFPKAALSFVAGQKRALAEQVRHALRRDAAPGRRPRPQRTRLRAPPRPGSRRLRRVPGGIGKEVVQTCTTARGRPSPRADPAAGRRGERAGRRRSRTCCGRARPGRGRPTARARPVQRASLDASASSRLAMRPRMWSAARR